MRLTVTNAFYTNFYLTNYNGTEILHSDFDATGTIVQSFTNIFFTNISVATEIEDNNAGMVRYLDNYLITQIRRSSGRELHGIESFPLPITNFRLFEGPYANIPGQVFLITNVTATTTNVMAVQTNVFCTTAEATIGVAAAGGWEDYESTDSTNITFDDFQIRARCLFDTSRLELAGAPPGPDYPRQHRTVLDLWSRTQ